MTTTASEMSPGHVLSPTSPPVPFSLLSQNASDEVESPNRRKPLQAREVFPRPFCNTSSLASSLSVFLPPLPDIQDVVTADLSQASAELAALAEAARSAADVCPDSIPLVEKLHAAVASELSVLKAEQTAAASGKTFDENAAAELRHRISQLRAATGQGLQVLHTALGRDRDTSQLVHEQIEGAGTAERAVASSAPTLSRTTSMPTLQGKEKEVAQIFGAVASNMRQAVLEIRQTKARHATSRSDAIVNPSL